MIDNPVVNAVLTFLKEDVADYKRVTAKKTYDDFYRVNFHGLSSDKVVKSYWVEYSQDSGVKSATKE